MVKSKIKWNIYVAELDLCKMAVSTVTAKTVKMTILSLIKKQICTQSIVIYTISINLYINYYLFDIASTKKYSKHLSLTNRFLSYLSRHLTYMWKMGMYSANKYNYLTVPFKDYDIFSIELFQSCFSAWQLLHFPLHLYHVKSITC